MAILTAWKLRVYTASCIQHAGLWKRLEWEWPEISFVARWPFAHAGNLDEGKDLCKTFWQHDHSDINSADALMVYAKRGEHLRGALVEAGMAIQKGIPVLVVGTHHDYGSWQHHPGVYPVVDLPRARLLLQTFAIAER